MENQEFFSHPKNLISIYTAVKIIQTMKERNGLEAMLEFVSAFCSKVERDNPAMKKAVIQALTIANIEKMHRDATGGQQCE